MTTTPTLSFGTALTSPTDALQTRSLAEVHTLITTDAGLQHTTTRLRNLRTLDADAFRTAKTRLPYVVGSVFAPNEAGQVLRRTEQFGAAFYAILDIDHCPDLNGQLPDSLRDDEYVALAFVSPSGMGLKVVVRLLEPCTDARQFQLAYRAFAGEWALRHRWATGLDLRTSDVTRACFLAHDPTAYLNPNAMPVDWSRWQTEAEADLPGMAETPTVTRKPATERPLNETAYQQVLRAVAGKEVPVRREKQTFVPDALLALEPDVQTICTRMGWTLLVAQPLNYGLKFVVRQGHQTGEVNVHWGKRGFSVVRSPKTGTDPALTDRLHEQLFALLFPTHVVENVPLTVSVN